MPSGSSWQAAAAHLPTIVPIDSIFQIRKNENNWGWKSYHFWTIHDISCRCLQEAVDKLFQRTPQCKITHSLSFKIPFNSTQTLFWDEITSLCLKVSHPPDTFRKQLTSCCRTPSIMSANILNFSIVEKSKQMGMKKLPFLDNSWYFLQMPSGSSWQAVPAHSKIQKHTHPIF